MADLVQVRALGAGLGVAQAEGLVDGGDGLDGQQVAHQLQALGGQLGGVGRHGEEALLHAPCCADSAAQPILIEGASSGGSACRD